MKKKEQQKELQSLKEQYAREREHFLNSIEVLQFEKQSTTSSFDAINNDFRDLKNKIRRLVDDARVEYSGIVNDENDIVKIFSLVECFHREQTVQNRKALRSLEGEIEKLRSEIDQKGKM